MITLSVQTKDATSANLVGSPTNLTVAPGVIEPLNCQFSCTAGNVLYAVAGTEQSGCSFLGNFVNSRITAVMLLCSPPNRIACGHCGFTAFAIPCGGLLMLLDEFSSLCHC